MASPSDSIQVACDLKDELDHSWGGDQARFAAVRASVVQVDGAGSIVDSGAAWAHHTNDPRVINVARLLQSLDDDHSDGKINIRLKQL